MAKEAGMGDQLYVGGYDLGGDINSLSAIRGGNTPIPMTDITQYAMARQGGQRDGGIEFMCYFDSAANASHDRFSLIPTTDVVSTYGRGSVIGNACASLVAKQNGYNPNRTQDGGLLFSIAMLSNAYGLEWGRQATAGKRTDTAATAAGAVTALDQGSASPGAFGLQMYVHLFAFTGTSVTIKLQESSDNSGDAYTDVVGATTAALSAANQGVRIATGAIAVERYLKVVTTGTFSNAIFMVQATRNPVEVVF